MVPPGAAASSVLWASLAITHACCSCLLLLHAPVYSLNVAMLSSWVFVFFFFWSWDHGSSCLCQHMPSVLIVCLVLSKFLPQLKRISFVRSFPSFLQSASQSLGHFFPHNPNFPSHCTGYPGRCCPPGVDLAGLAS